MHAVAADPQTQVFSGDEAILEDDVLTLLDAELKAAIAEISKNMSSSAPFSE